MQITQIDKEIIDIIGDYMNKTLSKGCLIDIDGNNKNIQKIGELDGENAIVNIYGSRWLLRKGKSKIIGHYEITAVEEYISNFNDGVLIISIRDGYRFYYKSEKDSGEDWFLKIPNKPLHLYTEEEKQELLKVLTLLA